MTGPYLWLREKLGTAVKGAQAAIVGYPWRLLRSQELACGWAGRPPCWQGLRVQNEQDMGYVGAPAPASHWEGRTWDWDMSSD